MTGRKCDLRTRMQNAEAEKLFWETTSALFTQGRLCDLKDFVQHGDTSCFAHSIQVAYLSMRMAQRLHIRCRLHSMVRAALLHDYFLYDWHEKCGHHKLHGFTHPGTAMQNAVRDYGLNPLERNIIHRHMFPLTLIPPRTREGLIVCVADKICSLSEVFHFRPFRTARAVLLRSGALPRKP